MNRLSVRLASTFGGRGLERLSQILTSEEIDARALVLFSPAGWRERMNGGNWGRISARLQACLFPFAVLREAVLGDMEILVATTNPLLLPWVSVATRSLHGRAVILLVYERYPDALEAVGPTKAGSLVSRTAGWINRYSSANADGVVFISDRMSDHAMRRHGQPKRWTVVEAGGIAEACDPSRLGPPSEESNLEVTAKRLRQFINEVRIDRSRARRGSVGKRAFDALVAGAGLLLTAPLLLTVAAAIRVTMGAPVLFRQVRPGLHGKPFELLKFRTMRESRPGERVGESDAVRMTRLGRLLRAASLDELPTLINVLRGDMSLVGPRPLLLRYLDRYSPQQARRHDVRPGVTGWAQVHGRNAISWEEKFRHDVWYVDNLTWWRDLQVLVLTFFKVLAGADISQEGHATMPEFMGRSSNPASGRDLNRRC